MSVEVALVKTVGGTLAPATEEEAAKMRAFAMGEVLRADIAVMRNGKRFRRWWVLAHLGYEVWCETVPTRTYKGQQVQPNFERFRKDLIVWAGFYEPVFNVRGEVRLEAKSIAWGNMKEDEFERLYSATIDVILNKIVPGRGYTEEGLRNMVDQVLSFA
jgi:hypothetical protein